MCIIVFPTLHPFVSGVLMINCSSNSGTLTTTKYENPPKFSIPGYDVARVTEIFSRRCLLPWDRWRFCDAAAEFTFLYWMIWNFAGPPLKTVVFGFNFPSNHSIYSRILWLLSFSMILIAFIGCFQKKWQRMSQVPWRTWISHSFAAANGFSLFFFRLPHGWQVRVMFVVECPELKQLEGFGPRLWSSPYAWWIDLGMIPKYYGTCRYMSYTYGIHW